MKIEANEKTLKLYEGYFNLKFPDNFTLYLEIDEPSEGYKPQSSKDPLSVPPRKCRSQAIPYIQVIKGTGVKYKENIHAKLNLPDEMKEWVTQRQFSKRRLAFIINGEPVDFNVKRDFIAYANAGYPLAIKARIYALRARNKAANKDNESVNSNAPALSELSLGSPVQPGAITSSVSQNPKPQSEQGFFAISSQRVASPSPSIGSSPRSDSRQSIASDSSSNSDLATRKRRLEEAGLLFNFYSGSRKSSPYNGDNQQTPAAQISLK